MVKVALMISVVIPMIISLICLNNLIVLFPKENKGLM